ncbi:MAG: FtsQ-type POTRA domain-containing protein [Deltaproteobacteria bacterium]|nr:FtsQ-type POTRA domain-containing protein [Deltaproteobacteria bacterium]
MNQLLQHQMVQRQRQRKARLRKSILQVERIARVVFVWACGIGLLYGAYMAIFTHDFFRVSTVVIRGDLQRLDEATIRDRAGVAVGDHLFRLSMRDIQARLQEEPWIREVAVRRKLPNTIWIFVIEYDAAAIVYGDAFFLTDAEGHIFKQASLEELGDLPILSGIDDMTIDQQGVRRSTELLQLLDVYHLFDRHPLSEHFGCSEIVRERYGHISIVTDQPAVRFRLGEHPSRAQLDRLYTVLSALTSTGRTVSAIDLFMERKVVVRYDT